MNFVRAALAVFATLLALPAQADVAQISDERQAVLACVETMQTDADWGVCLGLMFAPCADQVVGSAAHVDCLFTEREDWRLVVDGQFQTLTGQLSAMGVTELGNLLGQWTGYVSNKCNQVAQGKEGAQADAAQYGCEISETVGVSAELNACLLGVSTAPFCTPQE